MSTHSDEPSPSSFKRSLTNRHVQLIALGGAVGTGLFLGSAHTIELAGPAILLGYAVTGLIAFLIMRQLSEMMVEEPVAGSFSHFAHTYWGPMAGFISGWNYWVLYILVSMAELSAVGSYVQYWWPALPTWVSTAVCFVLINAINFRHVKMFGELEFWLSLVKVAAIIAMILFGGYLLLSGHAGPQAHISNLWALGGFMPHGLGGLLAASAIIMFSFGGMELVGIAAAETDNPSHTIPRATNQVVLRILIFYIGSQAILLSLYPWSKVVQGGSPFVLIFAALHSPWVATALNAVVLIAALSVYNSATYSTSRMLMGLALQGNAPRRFSRLNMRGVPVNAQALSALVTAVCVLLNYLMPQQAFTLLMLLVVAALVLNWIMITLTHLHFRRYQISHRHCSRFPSPLQPFTDWLCLAFLLGILLIMLLTPGMRGAVIILPIWLVAIVGCYRLKRSGESAAA
ncbi:amino acid permease [Cernens ardua]|uniref:amino acid permease n=1 Tax=Cernens ardua TaxID=3402176 RepID=UPI003F961EA9